MPVFGSAAVKVQPNSPVPYVNGYPAADILPAQHLNWFLANLTSDDTLAGTALNHVIAELDGFVTGSGASIIPGDDTQVLTAIKKYLSGYTLLVTGSSPYTLVADYSKTLVVIATTNPYIVNLPQTSGCLGFRVRIIDGSSSITGLVRVHPFTGDAIGSAGANVDCYLQNVDQSGATFLYQSMELMATAAGYWDVVAGQFCPHQAVDTDGSQYHLGKLHHLPLGNTINRVIGANLPAQGAWTAAQQATGLVGIPLSAKGIRAKILIQVSSLGAGLVSAIMGLSDNNSNVPTTSSAHPIAELVFTATAISQYLVVPTEVDIPLNSSGQFYIYGIGVQNCSPSINIMAVGFYMGD